MVNCQGSRWNQMRRALLLYNKHWALVSSSLIVYRLINPNIFYEIIDNPHGICIWWKYVHSAGKSVFLPAAYFCNQPNDC